MNYKTWERKLKNKLKSLPKTERERAVEYYREMHEDMASYGRSEEAILTELGTPESCAKKILTEGEYAKGEEKVRSPKKGVTFFEIIGLALITLLFVLPIGGAVIAVIIAFAAVCIAGAVTGIAGIIAAIAYPIYIGAGVAAAAGAGLFLAASGIGLLLFVAFFVITKYSAIFFGKTLKAIYKRR